MLKRRKCGNKLVSNIIISAANIKQVTKANQRSCATPKKTTVSASQSNRAVHDYEYIQIQYDYYGMIIITIQLWCSHSLAKYIQLSYNDNTITIQYDFCI